jgi:hypothetical protein
MLPDASNTKRTLVNSLFVVAEVVWATIENGRHKKTTNKQQRVLFATDWRMIRAIVILLSKIYGS